MLPRVVYTQLLHSKILLSKLVTDLITKYLENLIFLASKNKREKKRKDSISYIV